MAEVAVHLNLATLEPDYVMLTIHLPDDISVQKLTEKELPANWDSFPYKTATQAVGDRFVSNARYCVLQLPSAVTKGDHNFLLNPHHAEFKRVKIVDIEPFPFDERIFG